MHSQLPGIEERLGTGVDTAVTELLRTCFLVVMQMLSTVSRSVCWLEYSTEVEEDDPRGEHAVYQLCLLQPQQIDKDLKIEDCLKSLELVMPMVNVAAK